MGKRFWVLGFFVLLAIIGCNNSTNLTQVEQGQVLYEQHCQSCHGEAATGKGILPDVPRHDPQGHTWHHADGQLTQIILGELNVRGRRMPSFEGVLSENDVEAILAYLKIGWIPEQREFQAEVSKNWLELQN